MRGGRPRPVQPNVRNIEAPDREQAGHRLVSGCERSNTNKGEQMAALMSNTSAVAFTGAMLAASLLSVSVWVFPAAAQDERRRPPRPIHVAECRPGFHLAGGKCEENKRPYCGRGRHWSVAHQRCVGD
jgi:hypothetical protein